MVLVYKKQAETEEYSGFQVARINAYQRSLTEKYY